MSKKKADNTQDCPKKVLDKLPEGFADAANSMKEEELKKVIFEAEGSIYTIENERDADTKLTAAKEMVKDLGSSYREARGCQQAKIKYALFILNSRGVDLDHTEATD